MIKAQEFHEMENELAEYLRIEPSFEVTRAY